MSARILIVDDDERNAFAAAQALESLGHELVIARSGQEALRKLLDEEFAVILLDLNMPEMDGYETASLIRGRRRTALTPIVFLTAIFRDEAHVFQAYSAGAVDVVFKPVDPFILRSKVKVLADLHLKTAEIARQAAYQAWLLGERQRADSERRTVERRLRLAEARQSVILKSLPIIFHARTAEPPFTPTFISGAVREMTGHSGQDFLGAPDFASGCIHPDDFGRVVREVTGALSTGAYACEYRLRCADGRYRLFQDQGILAPAVDGQPQEIWGSIIDVTERRSLEEQLAQARKMEAVGQLTGGVAHDFNNLLTVILGNAEMLAERREDDAKRALRIEAVRTAADRGRTLTRQLLAFARRQQLNPAPKDVNALIAAFAPLLRQAVGEAMQIDYRLSEGELCAVIDGAQLETALLNLAVNARDAMPEGGGLSISTRAVSDDLGHWVEVEVADTGPGMTVEVRDRAFEPFFTTKEIGLGSGLGLSQVYGFVSQSGGDLSLETAPGQGAIFRLRLPAAPGEAVEEPAAASPLPLGGSELILVVEDDAHVLALTQDMLKAQGYRVLTAMDAAEAMAVLTANPDIDALFSDVTMPGGVTGIGLARQARLLRPDLRILLTSGFIADGSCVGSEFPMLDKPFTSEDLAAALRTVLDAPKRRRRRAAPTARRSKSARRR
ncbi:MAG TPA: response regulator [Caulobacteraceae bacterium]